MATLISDAILSGSDATSAALAALPGALAEALAPDLAEIADLLDTVVARLDTIAASLAPTPALVKGKAAGKGQA